MSEEVMVNLPRFLRDPKLLDRLRALDAEYEREHSTGPLIIEAHYAQGKPQKVKVKSEHTTNAPMGKE